MYRSLKCYGKLRIDCSDMLNLLQNQISTFGIGLGDVNEDIIFLFFLSANFIRVRIFVSKVIA